MLELLEWSLVSHALEGQLHPGGQQLTDKTHGAARSESADRVLDLGCGRGPLGRADTARWHGLDPRASTGDRSVRAQAPDYPYRDESFDAVVSECTLSLVDDLPRAMKGLHRILSPGGRLAFSDFTATRPIAWPSQRLARLACVDRLRTQLAWRQAIKAAGFESVESSDESWALTEIEERALGNVDIYGLLDALDSQGPGPWTAARAFLDQARRLRDEGILQYHIFAARRGGP